MGNHRGAEPSGPTAWAPALLGGRHVRVLICRSEYRPSALVGHLEVSARGLAAMKRYMAAAAARAVPGGVVVDIGCGAGHDLELLAAEGLDPSGVNPSAVMTGAAAQRIWVGSSGCPLVRADGQALPIADAAVDGVRIERVLQHCADRSVVLGEARRVLRTGGFLAVFEPDWTSLRFGGDDPDHARVVEAVMHVAHPAVGAELRKLVREAGFRVRDRVSELSFGHSLASLPLRLAKMLERAVQGGRIDRDAAERWRARQDELEQEDALEASWEKILVVAEAP